MKSEGTNLIIQRNSKVYKNISWITKIFRRGFWIRIWIIDLKSRLRGAQLGKHFLRYLKYHVFSRSITNFQRIENVRDTKILTLFRNISWIMKEAWKLTRSWHKTLCKVVGIFRKLDKNTLVCSIYVLIRWTKMTAWSDENSRKRMLKFYLVFYLSASECDAIFVDIVINILWCL